MLFVSNFNNMTAQLLERFDPRKWPRVTLIYGASGLGKTLFLRLIYAKLTGAGELEAQPEDTGLKFPARGSTEGSALLTSSSFFAREYALAAQDRELSGFRRSYRSLDWLLLDDIQLLSGKQKSIEELLNTYEHLMERDGRVVFTLQAEAPDLKFLGGRLASRIRSGLLLPLNSPESAELLGFLDYKLKQRALPPLVGEAAGNVLPDLARQVKNLQAAEEALTDLLEYIHKNQGAGSGAPVSFKEFWFGYEGKLLHRKTPDNVLRVASEITGVPEADMLGKRRAPRILEARHLAMYAVRELCKISYSEIGRRFGKEHGAVLQACKGFEAKLAQDAGLRRSLEKIREAFSGRESGVGS